MSSKPSYSPPCREEKTNLLSPLPRKSTHSPRGRENQRALSIVETRKSTYSSRCRQEKIESLSPLSRRENQLNLPSIVKKNSRRCRENQVTLPVVEKRKSTYSFPISRIENQLALPVVDKINLLPRLSRKPTHSPRGREHQLTYSTRCREEKINLLSPLPRKINLLSPLSTREINLLAPLSRKSTWEFARGGRVRVILLVVRNYSINISIQTVRLFRDIIFQTVHIIRGINFPSFQHARTHSRTGFLGVLAVALLVPFALPPVLQPTLWRCPARCPCWLV